MSLFEPARARTAGRVEYRLYFALMYPFALMATTLSRVFTRAMTTRYTDDRTQDGSVFNETTASLNSVLPWIYMGR